MVPLNAAWSDLGSWDALAELTQQDEDGNRITGDVLSLGSRNLYVRSPDRMTVAVGLSDLTIVDSPDALYVGATDQAGKLKEAVAEMEKAGRSVRL